MFIPLLRRMYSGRRPTRSRSTCLNLEALETRLVPALTRLPPVLVNPTNPAYGMQGGYESSFAPPAVAVAEDAAGDFVVVWSSAPPAEEGGVDILAQRFGPTGNPLGPEITVATDIEIETQNPHVAIGMDSAGDFVIAFDTSSGIFASRYNSSGNALDSTPFQVDNPNISFEDSGPSVAMDDQGHFVITYVGGTDNGNVVLAQSGFDTGSQPLNGNPITVASASYSSFISYISASVSADATGNFVVAYENFNYYYGTSSVLAQQFDTAGDPLGSAITLSTSGSAVDPSVAVSRTTGDFAVTWIEAGATTPVFMAQVFNANGTALESPFAISPASEPPSFQVYDSPSVAADANGNFVAVWGVHPGLPPSSVESPAFSDSPNQITPDYNSAPTGDIYAQTFNASGALTGGTIQITTQPTAPGPTGVAMDSAGDFVVTYSSAQQIVSGPGGNTVANNSAYDIIAVIFRNITPPTPPPPVPPLPPSTPTGGPAIAIAILSGEHNSQLTKQPVLPPLPVREEIEVMPQLTVPTIFSPARNVLATQLVEDVGGTTAIGQISGRLFADLNGDGTSEPGKPPLAGRLVFLDLNNNGVLDEGEPVTMTNENGEYYFSGLSLQTYQVRQLLVRDDVQTRPANNDSYEVRLDNIRPDVYGRDFGTVSVPRRSTPPQVQPKPVPPTPPPSNPSSSPQIQSGGEEESNDD